VVFPGGGRKHFPREANRGETLFYKLELWENHSSTKMLIKIQIPVLHAPPFRRPWL